MFALLLVNRVDVNVTKMQILLFYVRTYAMLPNTTIAWDANAILFHME